MGVMQRLSLFPKIRQATRQILEGYIQHPKVVSDGPNGIDGYIVPSVRGNDAGIFGALALAQDAYKVAHDRSSKSSSGLSVFSSASVAGAVFGAAATAAVFFAVAGRRRAL